MKKTFPMAMITAPGMVEFGEKVLDQLGNNDILMRVKAAAICISSKASTPPLIPRMIGHELAGLVEKVGGRVCIVFYLQREMGPLAAGKCDL